MHEHSINLTCIQSHGYTSNVHPLPSLLLISLLCFLLLRHGGADLSLYQICGDTGNYTAKSTYQSNLRQLLASLPSLASVSDGFSNIASTGKSLDQVFGLALCRGDVNATNCRTCLDVAPSDILQLCPYDKAAVIWYDDCLLRYSNQNFTSAFNNSEQVVILNTQNIAGGRFPAYTQNTTIKNFFNQVVNTLLSHVADSAASNSNSGKLFATGELTITNGLLTIYGLVQCAPDMSGPECRQCLQGLINEMLRRFDGRRGGRILGVWCNLRYEVYPFYDGNSTIRLSSVAPGTFSVLCNLPALGQVQRAKLDHPRPTFIFDTDEVSRLWKSEESSSEFSLFDFPTIANSTNNFSIESKLGEGGFGPVYKGLLSNGLEIAIKRLSPHSGQGLLEFKNEIQLIAKLQHRNLVRLLGCCIQGEEKILIYEYMANKSLDFFLFGLYSSAWEVWKGGKWSELIDPSLDGRSETYEVVRCIHVALMCVQENAADRPTMSDVIAMLSSDSTSLPDPKQPAYFNMRIKDETEMASDFIVPVSENEITFTGPEGR
uniref:non-specific serine/threonine protein kinase n=1 Tax=Ananas comosus var. bracteatus TaxID=296719 RepID=A0A6V7NKQ9_ANACO|nr:unnamed protein product [Ananas comosus var. bracteatus]